LLCACSNPKDTVVPTSLDKLETIKPQLEKLSAEERELFGAYMLRHTVGAAMGGLFGIKSEPIPEGMTIGKAIDEQRDFKAQAAIREAEAKALKEKVLAEQAKAVEEMRKAAVVTLVSKKIDAERSYGVTISENLIVTFAFKNTSPKDISGIKGTVDAIDIFGEELSGFNLSYDTTIKAGETATWVGSRSVRFGRNEANDRKFAGLPDDKYTITWKPEMIVFADGTKLSKPADLR
jgi:hypothetical protein